MKSLIRTKVELIFTDEHASFWVVKDGTSGSDLQLCKLKKDLERRGNGEKLQMKQVANEIHTKSLITQCSQSHFGLIHS